MDEFVDEMTLTFPKLMIQFEVCFIPFPHETLQSFTQSFLSRTFQLTMRSNTLSGTEGNTLSLMTTSKALALLS